LTSGRFWSTTYQPALKRSKDFEAVSSEGQAELRCRHDDLDACTEVVVPSEDDIDLRRITITNHARRRIEIDVKSYAEMVLAR
jgi:cyclic beta-1,2-glucan synthetase